jgi:hypothetical protein
LDLAFSTGHGRTVVIAPGNGDGTFGAGSTRGVLVNAGELAASDVDLDGIDDLAIAFGWDLGVLLGRGDGTIERELHHGGGDDVVAVEIGDFDDDGRPDIATANQLSGDVTILLNIAEPPCSGALDSDSDQVDDVCDICPDVPNPDQGESVACVDVVEDGGQCVETTIQLVDPVGSGELLVFDTTAVVPDSVSFDLLAARCAPGNGLLNVTLNDVTLVSEDAADLPLCVCNVGVQTLTTTDPALLASIWSPDGAYRFRLESTDRDASVAWVRARLDAGPDRFEFCLFDHDGGRCDNLDLCDAGIVSEFVHDTTLPDPFSVEGLASALPYELGQLPDRIDLDSNADASRLCVTSDGLGMNCVAFERHGEQSLTINGATCGAGSGIGSVPDGAAVPGAPLTLNRAADGDVVLSWGPSCAAADPDYAVYGGTIGDFAGHEPISCSTSGSTTWTLPAADPTSFYLVVPRDASNEGSYGLDSDGLERSPSALACAAQSLGSCDP